VIGFADDSPTAVQCVQGAVPDREIPKSPPEPSGDATLRWRHKVIAVLLRRLHADYAKDREEPAPDRAARVSAKATVAIAVFTAATIVIGSLQFCALHNTDEKIGKQIAVMGSQLNVMENDKRPWVEACISLADPVRITEWNGSKGIGVHLKFVIKNYGQSPAINIRINP